MKKLSEFNTFEDIYKRYLLPYWCLNNGKNWRKFWHACVQILIFSRPIPEAGGRTEAQASGQEQDEGLVHLCRDDEEEAVEGTTWEKYVKVAILQI